MVSLGPGDAELITLKGLEALRRSDAIAVPTKSRDRSFDRSLTHRIVTELMRDHDFVRPIVPVYTPMRFREEDWDHQVEVLRDAAARYGHVSFVTLGDAGIYSTVYYLLDRLRERDPQLAAHSEVIPGVTSFSQASAQIQKPLCVGHSRLEIVPLIEGNLPTTTVYMRPRIGMSTDAIPQRGTLYTFEDLNFAQETITPHKIPRVRRYMTLLIDFFMRDAV
jgi:precorrin-2/cobalt-factor-2 C20-methyltransferase